MSSTPSWIFSGVDRLSECHAGFILSCNMYRPTSLPFCTDNQCFFSSGSKNVMILPSSSDVARVKVPSGWISILSNPCSVRKSECDFCRCSRTICESGCTYVGFSIGSAGCGGGGKFVPSFPVENNAPWKWLILGKIETTFDRALSCGNDEQIARSANLPPLLGITVTTLVTAQRNIFQLDRYRRFQKISLWRYEKREGKDVTMFRFWGVCVCRFRQPVCISRWNRSPISIYTNRTGSLVVGASQQLIIIDSSCRSCCVLCSWLRSMNRDRTTLLVALNGSRTDGYLHYHRHIFICSSRSFCCCFLCHVETIEDRGHKGGCNPNVASVKYSKAYISIYFYTQPCNEPQRSQAWSRPQAT